MVETMVTMAMMVVTKLTDAAKETTASTKRFAADGIER
jgi:hypothetical protein